jgi:tryptophan-rich sensory protein
MSSPWYDKCQKVPWQPPNYVFGIVWPILYAMYGILLYSAWGTTDVRNILIVGLVANLAWVPLYAANVVFALLLLSGMILISLKTIYMLKKRQIFLFAPYLAWLCFAWTLNAYQALNCSAQ